MEIGTNLKHARTACGLTQGEAAEKIGVSRQTLSNWENNHSYPDAVSLLTVSEVYDIRLDALLKDDKEVVEQAEQQQGITKRKRRIFKWIEVAVYIGLWASILVVGGVLMHISGLAQLYLILVPNAVLPMLVAAFSVIVGADEKWGYEKWILFPIGAVMPCSVEYALQVAFGHWDRLLSVDVTARFVWLGVACAGGGMLLGCTIRLIKRCIVKHIDPQ